MVRGAVGVEERVGTRVRRGVSTPDAGQVEDGHAGEEARGEESDAVPSGLIHAAGRPRQTLTYGYVTGKLANRTESCPVHATRKDPTCPTPL